MEAANLEVNIGNRTVVITINRPPMNALSRDTLIELETLLDRFETDDSIGAVVITGSGDKTFSAGADISEFAEMRERDTAEKISRRMNALFNRIERFPKPVIACVNGRALGGGNELQMACHLAIAADTAEFGLPEVRLGIMPGYGGTQRLPRLIGRRRALDLMLSGNRLSADTALEFGLINRVVPQVQLREEAIRWAEQLAAGPPIAMKGILDSAIRGSEYSLEQGLDIERENMLQAALSEDAVEGVAAFFSKRPAVFQGR